MRFLLDLLRRRRPAAVPESPAAVPEGWLVYAVADIHGEAGLLCRMLAAIRSDAGSHPPARTLVVFLGDYIDRGPDSWGVLERLTGDPLPGMAVRFLLGNHEAVMLDFLAGGAVGAEWLRFGGLETLASYGIAAVGAPTPARLAQLRDELAARLPPRHAAFLQGLEQSCTVGDYAFVHAGIRPGRPLEAQIPEDLLWIREPFLSDPRLHGPVIVHGHTVTPAPEQRPNRIGLDTGAYATGVLTALRLEGTDQRFLQVSRTDGQAL
jgi:serine/threonine protein phosphatase 1